MISLRKRITHRIARILRGIQLKYWDFRYKMTANKPLKNVILFESSPDMADNTKSVFDEMLRRGWNQKYTLVWLLQNPCNIVPSKEKNVRYCSMYGYSAKYYKHIAKVKISCNNFLVKDRPGQFCVYLSHGTAIKSIHGYYNVPDGIDCVLAASQQVIDLQSYELNFDASKIVALGFPRNDILCKQPHLNMNVLLETNCPKIIVWYPTYRQHKRGLKTGCSNALPILHSENCAKKLNEAAKQSNILIVLKPHFAQDVSYIKDLSLSNIRFINDEFYSKNGVSSYEFVAACDALITDYSSVYFDYTLCDKPIAAIWEDIEEYKQFPGLVANYEHLMKGAEKVYTLDDLISFVQRVGKNVDLLKTERQEIRDFANHSTDGKNSERVVDFLEKKLAHS